VARGGKNIAVESAKVREQGGRFAHCIGIGRATRHALQAQMTKGVDEAAASVEGRHVIDAVHADGGVGREPRAEPVQSPPPEGAAEAETTRIRAQDEQAHEAEGFAVTDD
jgi:hypothetical protein